MKLNTAGVLIIRVSPVFLLPELDRAEVAVADHSPTSVLRRISTFGVCSIRWAR